MNGRVLPWWLPLVLAAPGCFGGEKNALVSPSPFGPTTPATPAPAFAAHAPATEEAGRRVAVLGQKIVNANRQTGLRPAFTTVGAPQPEVFHRDTAQVVITEGLVRQCRTEEQLAAVLCLELGKMVSEREALAPANVRVPDGGPPPEVPVGTDARGTFGPADGTRYLELAHADRDRRRAAQPQPAPDPAVLARAYLKRAGYPEASLREVGPLLRQAEEHATLEKQMTAPAGNAPAGK